jgi:hypothetical protein
VTNDFATVEATRDSEEQMGGLCVAAGAAWLWEDYIAPMFRGREL